MKTCTAQTREASSRGVEPAGMVSSALWELGGVLAGFFGCACIVLQIRSEWMSSSASSLSPYYLAGFLAIFLFWCGYGLRFRRTALWLTNGVAAVLQTLLLVLALGK